MLSRRLISLRQVRFGARWKGTLKEDLEVENASEKYEYEKEKSLKAVHAYMEAIDLVPPKIANAPLWNEGLASSSEAIVKAERAPEVSIEKMQETSIEILHMEDVADGEKK
ncbi:hypothetical protein HDU97_007005 [Phlyctochytrium planicorne]|nr:hypothetical protein HDU97_007005 [Phlyctochytrium planicorne]